MKRRNFISRILDLKEGESKLVLLPFLYSFFAGASLSFFVTSATSLFLSSFKRDMLPVVFIASGVIVWLIGQMYSYIQKRKTFSNTVKTGLAFLLISIAFLLVFYQATSSLIIIFILYAWIRVFAYLHAVSFWGLLGRLFSLQQAKRLFGLITGGEVLASILSFFSIPFLLKIISTEDLLLISGIALLIGFLLIMFILKVHNQKLQTAKAKKKTTTTSEQKAVSFKDNKYYKLFFLVAFIPIFAQFFVDFIFQAQVKVEFPDKESLTAFVGLFFGVSAIIEFVLKTMVSGRMMSKYGIKLGLLAFPVILAFSFGLVSVVGVFYGTVTLFFSFVALGRLFTRAVRTSFNDPATQILYQPLPPDERVAFQNKVESGPKAYASIFAGILLLIFVKIPGVNLVTFSVFLLIVIFVWIKVALDIFTEYKLILQKVLIEKGTAHVVSRRDRIFQQLKNKIIYAKDNSQLSIVKLARIIFPFRTYKLIEQEKIDVFATTKGKYKFKELIQFSKSDDPSQRRIAAAELANYEIYKVERLLKHLLSDDNFRVRTEAIITVGKMKDKELFSYLINNFNIKEYRDTASSSMIHIGNQILDELSIFFRRLEYNPQLQVKSIDVFEEIGGEIAVKFLKSNINHPNPLISKKIIESLAKLNYQLVKKEKLLFSNILEDEIDNYVYIVSALNDLAEIEKTEFIYTALLSEKEDKKDKIFNVLSVIYEASSIRLIRENLESMSAESKAFALEIADLVIEELHKDILLPIFKNLPDSELISRYKFLFAYDNYSVEERLIDIVNSTHAKTSNYTKTAALVYLSNFKTQNTLTIFKANFTNPNKTIRQIAAYNIYTFSQDIYKEQYNLHKSTNPDIPDLLKELKIKDTKDNFVFYKLNMIKEIEIFSNISYKNLSPIAALSHTMKLEANNDIKINAKNAATFYILISGLFIDDETETLVDTGSILSIYNTKDNLREMQYTAKNTCILLEAQIFLLNNLLLENEDFSQKYFNQVWGENTEKTIQDTHKNS